jgi:hypothetical protein
MIYTFDRLSHDRHSKLLPAFIITDTMDTRKIFNQSGFNSVRSAACHWPASPLLDSTRTAACAGLSGSDPRPVEHDPDRPWLCDQADCGMMLIISSSFGAFDGLSSSA